MHACIVTPDFIGPIRNGGVGTACLGLAEALRDCGHRVSVLYGSTHYEEGDAAYWRNHYRAQGIDFYTPADWNSTRYTNQQLGRSALVLEDIRRRNYDLVHMADYGGLGFYLAQSATLAQLDPATALVTALHGPTAWSRSSNNVPLTSLDALIRDAMERGSAEHADAVISPSQYMLEWARARGWRLPKAYHAFYALPSGPSAEPIVSAPPKKPESLELVFFGRIEQRKGCYLFIDAINELLALGMGNRISVTFLGKINEVSIPRKTLELRVNSWPIRWKIIDDLESSRALSYLSAAPNRIAVTPSLSDNSPCAVGECLNRGLPLIATDVGGISELIADSSKPHVLTDPTSSALARAIRKTLADGPHRPLPSHSQAQARADLVEVHQEILARKRARSRLPQPLLAPGLKVFNSPAVHINTESHGMISVCLVHRNRPGLLIQALHGYEAQSFKNFEVIIADNGSTDDNTAFILQLIRERSPFTYPVRILELGENRFPEGARNAAASVAVGRWLKFHDDDNVPKPHELQVFAASIATGKAHAISCGLDVFDSDDYPTDQTPISSKVLFMGDGGAASYIENYMGDANFAIGRETFEKVGGFDERGYLSFAEDWCFLAKLKGLGYVVASIPDCLVWYRMNPTQRALQWRKKDIAGARNRVRNALAGRVSHEVQELIALAQSANPNRGAPG